MLKKEIKYTDFNGEETSDIFYFNLSKPELIELEVETNEGLLKMFERIIESKDNREIIAQFKKIVLLAYGQKSDDGKRFVKSDEIRKEFEQTAAYQELFMELASVKGAAVQFVTGIMPKDMVDKANVPTLPGLAEATTTPGV